MARIRIDGTILLNSLQMATFLELKSKAVDGVIHRDVLAGYKANVVRGIAKHGAMKAVGHCNRDGLKSYKLMPEAVVIEQPASKPRITVAYNDGVYTLPNASEGARATVGV